MSIGHRVVVYILAPMKWCVNAMGQPEGEPGPLSVERRVWQLGLRSILGVHVGCKSCGWVGGGGGGGTSDWSISVKEFVPHNVGLFCLGGSLEWGSCLLEL